MQPAGRVIGVEIVPEKFNLNEVGGVRRSEKRQRLQQKFINLIVRSRQNFAPWRSVTEDVIGAVYS